MRAERELMRGAGPVAVLKMLAGAEMYGYELAQALDERSGGVLDMGQSTLYPLLYNLQSKGLIRARWQTADSGRRRKYYALTDRGRRKLASDTEQWEAIAKAMAALGIIAPRPGAAMLAAGGAS